jgi:hypothetical protein
VTEIPPYTLANSPAVVCERGSTVEEEVVAGDLLPPPLSSEDQPILKRHSSVPFETGQNLPNYRDFDFAVAEPSVPNLESTDSGVGRPPTQPSCQPKNMG